MLVLVLVYAIIAMPAIFIFRRKQRKAIKAGLRPVESAFTEKVSRGGSGSQETSFVLHLLLVAIGIALIVSFNTFDPDESIADNNIAVLALTLLFLLTPITLIMNAIWVYTRNIVVAEQHAFETGTASVFLKVQHVLAWVIWVSYFAWGVSLVIFPEILVNNI